MTRLSYTHLARSVLVGLVLLAPSFSKAQDYTSDLEARWTLDETTGAAIADSAGTNTGTWDDNANNDVAEETAAGYIDTALTFDGVDDYILAGSANAIDNIWTDGGTISAWIYPTGHGENNSGHIASKANTAGNVGWQLHMDGGVGQAVAFTRGCQGGGFREWSTLNGSVPLNTWSHIVVVYNSNGMANNARIFINGTLAGLGVNPACLSNYNADASESLFIGNRNDQARTFAGLIDDVRIYDRALSAPDITELYNYTAPDYTCSNPNGITGELIFNEDIKRLQYCNASSWASIGPGNSLGDSLASQWNLDETGGAVVSDTGSLGNNGAYGGGIDPSADSVPGKVGNALDFTDGGGYRVDVPSNATYVNMAEMTMAAWINPNAFSNYMGILEVNGVGNLHMRANEDDITFGASAWSTQFGNWRIHDIIPANEWTHVAVTYSYNDAVGTAPIFYINGTPTAISATAFTPSGVHTPPASAPVYIGNTDIGGLTRNFHGLIDEPRIYNRILSASEITALYNNAPVCNPLGSNLAANWPMDETSGASIADATGTNDGTWTDSVNNDVGEETTAGQNGTALTFDGADDVIAVGSDPSIDDVFVGGGTLTAWINPNTEGEGNYGRIMVKGNGGGDVGWHWHTDGSIGSAMTFSSGCAGGGFFTWQTLNGSVPLNTWSHVALVYNMNSPANTPTFYVNGIAVPYTSSGSCGTFISSDAAINAYIGNRDDGARTFDGEIDDLRVYNRSLTAAEIMEIYGGTGGTCTVSTCSAPSGLMGEIVFNTDHDVMQYCNGHQWIAMGPPGDGGGGCANPTGLAAELRYNTDLNVLQYCEGDEWIAVASSNALSIPNANLLSHWTLDDTSGDTIIDSESLSDGQWHDNANSDVVDETTAGQVNTALTFDGVDDYIDISGGGGTMDGLGNASTCFWMNYVPGSVTSDGAIIGEYDGDGWLIFVDDTGFLTGNQNTVSFTPDDGSGVQIEGSTNLVTPGQWDHYCLTFEADTEMRIYKNGLVDTILTAGIPSNIVGNGHEFRMGITASDTRPINAILDDVRIFERTLSTAEVQALYTATK